MRTVLPVVLALASGVAAQETVSAVASVIASGTGLRAAAPPRTLSSASELAAALGELGFAGAVPAVDFDRRAVRLLALGEGRGGALGVTRAARGAGVLVRVEGAADAPVAADRWAAVAFRKDLDPDGIAFEWDVPAVHGQPAFAFTAPVGNDLTPFWDAAMKQPVGVQCITDWVAFAAFCRGRELESGASLAPPEEVLDFARQVVLVEPIEPFPTAGRFLVPDRIDFYRTGAGAMVRRRRYGNDDSGKPQPRFEPPRFGVYVLPRVTGTLDYEVPVAERPRTVRRAASFRVEEPAATATLSVLRVRQVELADRTEPFCARATTPAEWRALRQDVGGAVAKLPDDFCDFAGHSVIAVAAPTNHVFPGFFLSTAEEEGVDVLTAQQAGPSGVRVKIASYGFVAVVPDRKAQLAVVLSQRHGPGPGAERTLQVFPGR